MSRLLFKGPFIPYVKEVAAKVGTVDSIVLMVVSYWVYENASKELNYRDGSYWTYNTMQEWQKYLPGESLNTVWRAFKRLENKGFLISSNYNENKGNRTKWYTINIKKYDELFLEINNEDEVWSRIANSNLEKAFTQNGEMHKMGLSEDDYGKYTSEASSAAFTQNGEMHLPKMVKSEDKEYYKEVERETRTREADLVGEEGRPKPKMISEDWVATFEIRNKAKELYQLKDEHIAIIEVDFRDIHAARGTLRLNWDKLFLGYCELVAKRFQAKEAKPSKSKQDDVTRLNQQLEIIESSKRSEDCKEMFKQVLLSLGVDYWFDNKLWNLRIKSINGTHLKLERLMAYSMPSAYNHCLETILNAIKALKPQITNIEVL